MRFPRLHTLALLIMLTLFYCPTAQSAKTTFSEQQVYQQLHLLELPFELSAQKKAAALIKRYLSRYRGGTEILLTRTQRFFPIFEHYLQKYNVPPCLKYLPLVESRLKPEAISPAGAAGLWQFMPATGRHYGLQINDYIDERQDPYESSDAAARMLAELYDEFGDWLLVLAAYNCGPGRVRRAIRKTDCTDYTTIEAYLPKQTRRYVPAFIAMTYISNYYNQYDIQPRLLNPSRLVKINYSITFEKVSKIIGLTASKIAQLNPCYQQHKVLASKSGRNLLLPEFAARRMNNYLRKLHRRTRSFMQPQNAVANNYIVNPGDTLGSLAQSFNCTEEEIANWNNLKSQEIVVQQELVLYTPKAKHSRAL